MRCVGPFYVQDEEVDPTDLISPSIPVLQLLFSCTFHKKSLLITYLKDF